MSAFGGGLVVADTSAFNRSDHQSVCEDWDEALAAGRILICPPVELELLFIARNAATVEAVWAELSGLRRVPLTDTCARSAVGAMRDLAARGSDGHHRVRPVDALIAACAQEAGAAVLHYDHHYDRLAEVMAFESRWLLPPGSAERPS
jgi:predicted nucleic acid-binding protein